MNADIPMSPKCAACREPGGTCFPGPCKLYEAHKAASAANARMLSDGAGNGTASANRPQPQSREAPLTNPTITQRAESIAVAVAQARENYKNLFPHQREGRTLNQFIADAVDASLPPSDASASVGDVKWNGRHHDLKTWPEPFAAVRSGAKPWELRKDDRNYQVGDLLWLREWSPETEDYTGNAISRVVTWLLRGPAFGLPEGYVIMSLDSKGTATLTQPQTTAGEGRAVPHVDDLSEDQIEEAGFLLYRAGYRDGTVDALYPEGCDDESAVHRAIDGTAVNDGWHNAKGPYLATLSPAPQTTAPQTGGEGLQAKLDVAEAFIRATAHGDNCFLLNDGGQYDRCFCGKDSVLAYIEDEEPALSVSPSLEDLRGKLEEARDLLMERIHGNPARSAGHNARLAVEAALSALQPMRFEGVIPGSSSTADAACVADATTLVPDQDLHRDLVRCAEILVGLATWRRGRQEGRTFPSVEDCQFAQETLQRASLVPGEVQS